MFDQSHSDPELRTSADRLCDEQCVISALAFGAHPEQNLWNDKCDPWAQEIKQMRTWCCATAIGAITSAPTRYGPDCLFDTRSVVDSMLCQTDGP